MLLESFARRMWMVVSLLALTGCAARPEPPPDRTDSDFDGFVDRYDKCPRAPETANSHEDHDGCPDGDPPKFQRIALSGDQIRLSEPVEFKSGGDVIRKESYPLLNEVLQMLNENPELKVRIEGHTDNQGSDQANLTLSTRRAYAVMRYLTRAGIAPNRLQAEGKGETKPIASNDNSDGQATNRRVEFHVVRR